jgi:hypothetical protein
MIVSMHITVADGLRDSRTAPRRARQAIFIQGQVRTTPRFSSALEERVPHHGRSVNAQPSESFVDRRRIGEKGTGGRAFCCPVYVQHVDRPFSRVCTQDQHPGRFGGLNKMTVEIGFSRAGLMFVVAPAGEGGNEHA